MDLTLLGRKTLRVKNPEIKAHGDCIIYLYTRTFFSTSCSSNNAVLCTKVFKIIRNKVISMVNISLAERKVPLALNITF